MKIFDVIIIGAGPAGLCLSYHLKRLGLTSLILEKDKTAGSSWGNMPDHLSLVSLWKSNHLIPEDRSYFPFLSAVGAKNFFHYLQNFASKHELSIKYETEVLSVVKKDAVYEVRSQNELFHSRNVVNCTGYYSFPWTPENLRSVQGIPVVHMKDFKNAEQFKGLKRILIVGKRLSAGQIIEELSAEHELGLSVRSPLQFSSPPLIYKAFLIFLDEAEALVKFFKPKYKAEVEVKMEAKVKPFFKAGQIQIYPEVKEVRGKSVLFTDNEVREFDAIICATGFVPDWPHLESRPEFGKLLHGFESSESPGLYFLGFSSQRSFVSRFLRGIREDALALANLIADKGPHRK